MSLVLEVENLSLYYGKKKLFENVDLKIKSGEFVSVRGENGVGKTSLLLCLLGKISPKTGSLNIISKPWHKVNKGETMQFVSCVLQGKDWALAHSDINSHFESIRKLYSNWDNNLVDHLLMEFDLEKDKKFYQLSMGEYSKVKLIQALAIKPKLLLLDELTANLSENSKKIVLGNLIDQVSENELAVLYVGHDLNEIKRLSDSIYTMKSTGLERLL